MRGNKDTLNVATYHVAALQLRKSKKMSEKIFQSKKEVLEYLGKSPNDRKLVDRMISKGEIEKTED